MSFKRLPPIGMGTFRLKGDMARNVVKSALSLGYRHIDAASIYANEAEVGDGIVSSGIPRREIFLTTKIWFDSLHPSDLMNSLKKSSSNLKTDHVDLALIHWPSPADAVPMEDYLLALRDAQQEGLTDHIGVSNFTCAQMDRAKAILGSTPLASTLPGSTPVFTNQVEVHPFFANRKVVDHARQLGIAVTGYMPLAAGKVITDATLQRIGRAHNASAAQIAIAWIAARGIVPIPLSTRPQHQAANLDALRIRLSEEETAEIDLLDRRERFINPAFSPDWDD